MVIRLLLILVILVIEISIWCLLFSCEICMMKLMVLVICCCRLFLLFWKLVKFVSILMWYR